MAKKGKVVQMLSPENYIRQKARTLPILGCWVNGGWDTSGLANILLARSHTNGNVTLGLYLVDLNCLGVKDAHFKFNIPRFELDELLAAMNERMEMVEVEYAMAHNIIFAGLEFAEDYGFMPHKVFSATTRFMLEEDDDEIELIEIDCGMNGKPVYMQGPFESYRDVQKIIAQLNKTAGEGNYSIVQAGDLDEEEDYEDNDFDEEASEYEDLFEDYSLQEKQDKLAPLLKRVNELSYEEENMFSALVTSIYDQLLREDVDNQIQRYKHEYEEQFRTIEITGECIDGFLGMKGEAGFDRQRFGERFEEIFELAGNGDGKAQNKYDAFTEEFASNSALLYLQLSLLQMKGSPEYHDKLEKFYRQHPDYPIFKMLWDIENISHEKPTAESTPTSTFAHYFKTRKIVHHFEFFHYLMFLAFQASTAAKPYRLEALDWAAESIQDPLANVESIQELISKLKLKFILPNDDFEPITG